jgi:hypothetical protein
MSDFSFVSYILTQLFNDTGFSLLEHVVDYAAANELKDVSFNLSLIDCVPSDGFYFQGQAIVIGGGLPNQ